ncbi:hypothetical protein [Rhizobium binxianense]
MSFLYLVTKVAANAKYSINSFFSPVSDVTFWKVENRAQSPSAFTPPKCNALIPRSNFQKRTGLVTSGSVAAATSKPLKFETADSVKGWSLTDCPPQHLVDAPVKTGESRRSMKIQWLVGAAGGGGSKAGKKTRQSESFGSFCRANAHADSSMGISGFQSIRDGGDDELAQQASRT